MFERIKQKIEKNLIDEIKNLSASDLEYVGNYLLSILENQVIVHHGINKDGRPSGYTVDSFSQNASVIGEYSVEKDYFTNYSEVKGIRFYKKIHKDIEHARNHGGDNLKKIYLLTSQEEIPSFRKEFNKSKDFLDNRDKIQILDARLLAQEIYRQSVANVDHLAFYKEYFPDFAKELENYEYYGKIPPLCNNFCEDKNILKQIEKYYEKGTPICLLFGVSGSGKTQSVIEYVRYKAKEFQNYIWITGDDWPSETSLSSIQRTRGGMPINVVGLFNRAKTILVIDSLEREINSNMFSELEEGFSKGGRVIITSQIKSPVDFCMQMPEFSEKVARCILGEENDNELIKQVVNKCKGFPIILSTIRNIVLQEGVNKENLYSEILERPEELAGTEGKSLIRTILSKLSSCHYEKLISLANTYCSTFDINFIRDCYGIQSCSTLQKVSILMKTNVPGIVKIHDLICVSVRKKDESDKIVEMLLEYIDKKNGEMTPSILRQIYLLRAKIVTYKVEHDSIDWLTYALLQIEGDEKDRYIEALCKQRFSTEMNLAMVMCLIEARELKGYHIKSREKVEKYFDELILEYESALKLYENTDICAELSHHIGKAYRRRNRYEEAFRYFKKVLAVKEHWHATHGQIVTLGTMKVSKEIIVEAEKSMRKLLKDMIEDAAQVPLRVSLATIGRMRSYRKITKEIINKEEDVKKISQIVASAAIEDIGQFFEGFVAFTSIFMYRYSDICLELAENISDMIMVSPKMIDDKQWLNACEALANIAAYMDNEKNQKLFDILIDKSIDFGEAYLKNKNVTLYASRAIAKAYIIKGEGAKALEIINLIPEAQRDHWILYRQAQAENILGYKKAIDTANKAVELLEKDEKNVERKSSYYQLLSECYRSNGEKSNAKRMNEKAIEVCNDLKYKEGLMAYKAELAGKCCDKL